MAATTVECDARDSQGRPCGAIALVTKVHYKYVPHRTGSSGEVEQVLEETHYDIECPKCGPRRQVQKVGEA